MTDGQYNRLTRRIGIFIPHPWFE